MSENVNEKDRRTVEMGRDIKYTVVFGRVEFVEDEETIIRLCRELSYKFTKDEVYIDDEIKHHAWRTLMFAIVPEHITGKRVKES